MKENLELKWTWQWWEQLGVDFREGRLKTIAFATWDNWIQENQDLIAKRKVLGLWLRQLRAPKVFD